MDRENKIPEGLILHPAIILRPMLSARETGGETCYIGGAPRLPDLQDWPFFGIEEIPYHFFALIDLSVLPRSLEAGGVSLPMPEFPASGFLNVFLPLHMDFIYNFHPVVQFFEDLSGFDEIPPPEDVPDLAEESDVVDPDAVTEDGQMLRQRALEPIAYMSSRPVTPHSDEPSSTLTPDLVTAAEAANIGIVMGTPQPGTKEIMARAEASAAHGKLQEKSAFHRTQQATNPASARDIRDWPLVFEYTRFFLIGLLDEAIQLSKKAKRAGDRTKHLGRAIQELYELKSEIQYASNDSEAPDVPDMTPAQFGWLRRRRVRREAAAYLDVEAVDWMRRAKGQTGQLASTEVEAFAAFRARSAPPLAGKTSEPLLMLAVTPALRCKPGKLLGISSAAAEKAFEVAGPEAEDIARARAADTAARQDLAWEANVAATTWGPDLGYSQGSALQPLQMFGEGDMIHSAHYDNRDKILLLQIGNRFGTGIDFGDTFLQIWISRDDLRTGRFDRIDWTVETS
jgi:uncharacterized protein YwqG